MLSSCISIPSSGKAGNLGPWEYERAEPSPNKKRLLNYLYDQYGEYIISGQMDTSWTVNKQMDMIARVYEDTGKFPAIKGFDLLQLNFEGAPFYGGREQINEAIEWWEGKNRMNGNAPSQLLPDEPGIHGIPAFCWHWRQFPSSTEYPEFSTDKTSFRIPWKNGKLDTSSKEFKSILIDLDKVAVLFHLLKDRDIPVLWRPMHEASGNWRRYGNTGNDGAWFWWGASGPEPYIALWEFIYGYFTYEKGLNNLIWVWNGQHKEWRPNPSTIEIAGNDIYSTPKTYGSLKAQFDETLEMIPVPDRERMIIALTENGVIPDPDNCIRDGAMWSFFMTWNDGRKTGETHEHNFWSGEYNNTGPHKNKVYNHDKVITLDKLPDLTKYRLE
jgi:mannan endo-1,4-beta-mannosidase